MAEDIRLMKIQVNRSGLLSSEIEKQLQKRSKRTKKIKKIKERKIYKKIKKTRHEGFK